MEVTTIKTMFCLSRGANILLEYLGIIESINSKISRLMRADFEAAVKALRSACNSVHQKNYYQDIERALSLFERALSQEDGLRLVLSYLGLALCYRERKEPEYGIFKEYLRALLDVKIPTSRLVSEEFKQTATNIGVGGFILPHRAVFSLMLGSAFATAVAIRGKPIDKNEEYDQMIAIQESVKFFLEER